MHCRIGMFYFPTQCVIMTVTFHKNRVIFATHFVLVEDLKEKTINIVKWNSGKTPSKFWGTGLGYKGYLYIL